MAQRMVVQKLTRLTLVRKGRAMAKHPDMRDGVVEAVKSTDEVDPSLDSPSYDENDWYRAFDAFVATTPLGPDEDVLEAFAATQKESAAKKQKKNYPDSEGPFAGPHNSFPIRNAGDVIHAAERLHNAKGSQAKIKARIVAIARAHGYPLPKTWQKGSKTEKSLDIEKLLGAIRSALTDVVKSEDEPEEEPTTDEAKTEEPVEAPEAEAEVEAEEEAEKASRSQGHAHPHVHASMRGYEYSHTHAHGDDGHTNMADHDQSETAHAHEHVAKAGENPEMDGLLADAEGLKKDLDAARAELKTAKESASKLAAAEAEVESLKAQVTEVTKKAERKPLTAPVAKATEERPTVKPNMSYDDAFDLLMGRTK